MAEAHREGFLGLSGERVSDSERAAVDEIAATLGLRRRRRLASRTGSGSMVSIDTSSFFVIVAVAAIAALIVAVRPRPVSCLLSSSSRLLLGILIGPDVLDIAERRQLHQVLLEPRAWDALLLRRVRDRLRADPRQTPLRLGAIGWALSVALAYGIGGLLAAAGVVISFLYTGSAMATTAIGTLIPILRDNGELKTRFGTDLLGRRGDGRVRPDPADHPGSLGGQPAKEALILLAFVALAIAIASTSVRLVTPGWRVLESTLESSSQLAVRIAVVLVFGLVAIASDLGLDILLGGFVAGLITRVALKGHEVEVFESKLTAVGFGFLIPFFFVTSGITFDLDALLNKQLGAAEAARSSSPSSCVVRGAPALLLYRNRLDRRDRVALGFFSATELPLVVAITTIAVEQGHMGSTTSAALVGAAIISTLVYPQVGLALRRGREGAGEPPEPEVTVAAAG